jgi:mRNA interferase HigB
VRVRATLDFGTGEDNHVPMRVIKKKKLDEFFKAHPQGKNPLLRWYEIVRRARWQNLDEMRKTFPAADEVPVKSGRKAVVFNIKRNDYRLITAVHYEKTVEDRAGKAKLVEGKVYLFFFLTHTEYDKESWKEQL